MRVLAACRPLVGPAVSAHMSSMSGRPCNPGSDLRQLWQALLGNTPFPQCGVSEKRDTSQKSGDAPDREQQSEGKDGSAVQRYR